MQIRRILSRVPNKLPAKGYIESEPKTQKSRRNVVIAPFELQALKRHYQQQLEVKKKAGDIWQEHGYVFCTPLGEHIHPGHDILEEFKKLLKRAGLPDVRFHDLRHSAASMLLAMGVHPKVVQELLGHNQISMTMDT